MEPIQRVNVDFTATMLQELDGAAKELNVSRQAVIKTLLWQALDQHYLAKGSRDSDVSSASSSISRRAGGRAIGSSPCATRRSKKLPKSS